MLAMLRIQTWYVEIQVLGAWKDGLRNSEDVVRDVFSLMDEVA